MTEREILISLISEVRNALLPVRIRLSEQPSTMHISSSLCSTAVQRVLDAATLAHEQLDKGERMKLYTADTVEEFEIKVIKLLNLDDDYTIEVCRLALAPSEYYNADGTPLVGPDGKVTTRTAMRSIVAAHCNILLKDD